MHPPFKFLTSTATFSASLSLSLFLFVFLALTLLSFSPPPHAAFAAAAAVALHHGGPPPTNTSSLSPTLIPRERDSDGNGWGFTCSDNPECPDDAMEKIMELAAKASGCNAAPGEYLFCTGNVCLFPENNSIFLPDVMPGHLLPGLKGSGCTGCGQMYLPISSNTGKGSSIMKVEHVEDTKGCKGVCKTKCP